MNIYNYYNNNNVLLSEQEYFNVLDRLVNVGEPFNVQRALKVLTEVTKEKHNIHDLTDPVRLVPQYMVYDLINMLEESTDEVEDIVSNLVISVDTNSEFSRDIAFDQGIDEISNSVTGYWLAKLEDLTKGFPRKEANSFKDFIKMVEFVLGKQSIEHLYNVTSPLANKECLEYLCSYFEGNEHPLISALLDMVENNKPIITMKGHMANVRKEVVELESQALFMTDDELRLLFTQVKEFEQYIGSLPIYERTIKSISNHLYKSESSEWN